MRLTYHAAVVAMVLSSMACQTNTNTKNRPLFPDGWIVIEAVVLNGLTGAPVASPNLRVQVGHHVLPSEDSNGLYYVYGVPNNTPVFVLADAGGYSPFIAMVSVNGAGNVLTGDYYYQFYNVMMYPMGTVPGNIVVSVYTADGTPIDSATVVATMTAASAMVPVSSPLASGVGILPNSVVATTSGGKATFSGASLILGADYSIDVFGALDAAGVFLTPSQNNTVTIGEEIPEIVVFLDRPAMTPVALQASNEATGIGSQLAVTFPYPIELCTPTASYTWTNTTANHTGTADTDMDFIVAAPAAVDPVTAARSVGDTVLTLGYVAGVGATAFDAGDVLWVRFNNVLLKPKGAGDGSCTLLGQVELRSTGSRVNTEIHASQP
jgi:hypothetical protein